MKPIKKENKGSQLFSSMIEGQKRDFNKHLLSKTIQPVNSSEQKMKTVVRETLGKNSSSSHRLVKKALKVEVLIYQISQHVLTRTINTYYQYFFICIV